MRMKGSVEIFAVLGTFTFSVILDRNNVWFQKLSIPPPWKGFFLRPPHPSGNSSQASYTHLNFWAFDNPPPPSKFQSLLWGNGYFLKLHNEILYFLLSILLSIDLKCEWVHFTPSFLNNENEGNNQQAQKRLLLTGK